MQEIGNKQAKGIWLFRGTKIVREKSSKIKGPTDDELSATRVFATTTRWRVLQPNSERL